MEHLSKSAVEKYINCGESYRRRYIIQETAHTNSSLIFGIAFHQTLEQYVLQHAENNLNFDIFDYWMAAYEQESRMHGIVLYDENSPEEDIDTGIRMLGADELKDMLDALTPAMIPIVDEEGERMAPAVEMKLEFAIPHVDPPFVGYVDLLTDDGIPMDFKTAARKWSPEKAQAELQPAFYIYGLGQMGRPVPNNTFKHLVITKGKNPTVTIFETQRSEQEIAWALRLAALAYKGIEKGVFVPNPLSWVCSPKYCEFYASCMGGENAGDI
jgi:hypothetical protein